MLFFKWLNTTFVLFVLLAWIGALQITMTFFLSPVASILVDRFGIRQTGFTGAFLATAGMLASSFVHQVEVLYLTYGLMLGIGSSLIYNPSLVILGHYFRRHLGVVNGLVSFGSAVFTIVFPFLLKETLQSIGLQNTMRMLAGFLSLLMIGSLTWKPLFNVRHAELDHYLSTDSMPKSVAGCCMWMKKFLNVAIWRNKGYVIWAICLPISFLGYFIPFVHLVSTWIFHSSINHYKAPLGGSGLFGFACFVISIRFQTSERQYNSICVQDLQSWLVKHIIIRRG